jgi:hypothetical protein
MRKRMSGIASAGIPGSGAGNEFISSTSSVHESHKYGVHTNYMAPTLHFHLAASINASTGKFSV